MNTPQPPDEPLIDVARGDVAESRQLRHALTVLRDRSDNAQFRELVDEVLQGRRGLRDVFLTQAFADGLNPGVEQFASQYEALSDEERRQLADEGERQLAADRERIERQRAEQERNSR
jgi:hypothetical protein